MNAINQTTRICTVALALCLLAGAFAAQLEVTDFTLAWTHSVERVRWEEDWRVESKRLVLIESRIKGSGAGMEPPPDAVLARANPGAERLG